MNNLLSCDHADSAEYWAVLHRFLSANYERLVENLDRYVPEEQILHFLALLLVSIGRVGFKTSARREQLFTLAENMGIHLFPVHYYSPVPDTKAIRESVWSQRADQTPGLPFNVDAQLELLQALGKWAPEMSDIPAEAGDRPDFFWNNPAFAPADASVYYSIIREYKPATIIEVGSGYSTLLAARAALRNGNTRLECIEPYPMAFLRDGIPGLTSLKETALQDVSVSEFERLGPNDLLFIDSTHVSKIGSDVNYLFFNVLPILKPGVLVHIHDIFLPWDMPRTWIQEKHIFWNEQYLLLAFLLFNNSYEVVLGNQFLGREHREAFQRAFPEISSPGGGSFWIRRT